MAMVSTAYLLFGEGDFFSKKPVPYTPDRYTDYKNPCQKLPAPPNGKDYGSLLVQNKAKVLTAIRANGLPREFQFLVMAMAMQETNTLSEFERDCTKDKGNADAANYSIFNLNMFFIKKAGGAVNYDQLNSHDALADVVRIIYSGIKILGLIRALKTIRGGESAFVDGKSYGAADYPHALKSSISVMDDSVALLQNNKRVACDLSHV